MLWCVGYAVGLGCSTQSAKEAGGPEATAVAPISRDTIEHVAPKRDFVGAAPARFEWTAAAGVDDYAITVHNEVDMLIFEARVRGTSLEWPKANALDPGTYFWRVVGVKEGRRVADSGRAAFVVADNPDRARQ
jgi:hypothetical protein